MFDPLTRGKIGELFGTETNLTPGDILDGKIVVIDIPVAKYREVGQYAALIPSSFSALLIGALIKRLTIGLCFSGRMKRTISRLIRTPCFRLQLEAKGFPRALDAESAELFGCVRA